MNMPQKMVIFLKKTMKAYFKPVMLSIKIYENILKSNFLIAGIRHTDCLCKFFKAIIYRCKKRWRCRNFITTLKYLWIDTREWARCKTMKTCVYSLYYSSASSGFSKRCCQCTFSGIFKGRQIILEPCRNLKYSIWCLLWQRKILLGGIWTQAYSEPLQASKIKCFCVNS